MRRGDTLQNQLDAFLTEEQGLAVAIRTLSSRSQTAVRQCPYSVVVAALMILVASCGGPASAPPTAADGPEPVPPVVERLLRLMRDRLILMHDVARTKWNAHRPVGDPKREQSLLREMEEKSPEHRLDPEFTRSFFVAQITAARLVQEADLARWEAEERGPFAEAPALEVLRMRIDAINRDLLDVLAEARRGLADENTREQLLQWARGVIAGEGISDDVRAAAIAPLAVPWPEAPAIERSRSAK